MTSLTFSDHQYACPEGETVLDVLLSEGLEVPYSCKTGACQTCLMKASSGSVPTKAQNGLKDSLKAQSYFLACQCIPEEPLTINLIDANSVRQITEVIKHERLTEKVVQLQLKRPENFHYIPGQYLTLWKDNVNGRSYSLASVPALDDDVLELHIRRVEGGEISTWLYDEVTVGDKVSIQDAVGHCCYTPVEQSASLLLAGAGTGLAPLIGIARDALHQGHSGAVHLFHSARQPKGLYKNSELIQLSRQYKNFFYHPVLDPELNFADSAEVTTGDLNKIVLDFVNNPKDWRFYLCGSEKRVTSLRKLLFLSGAAMKNIYADAFVSRTQEATVTG